MAIAFVERKAREKAMGILSPEQYPEQRRKAQLALAIGCGVIAIGCAVSGYKVGDCEPSDGMRRPASFSGVS